MRLAYLMVFAELAALPAMAKEPAGDRDRAVPQRNAQPSNAEPKPAAPDDGPKAAAPDDGPKTAAPADGDRAWTIGAQRAPAPQTSSPTRADLFDPKVLGKVSAPSASGSGHSERSPGVRFGDDGWKSQVAQIGGMVAGFAALSALCGTSRCMLPKGMTSWIPGTTTEAPPAPARVGPRVEGMPKLR